MSSATRLLSNKIKYFVVLKAEEGDKYDQIVEKVKKMFQKDISKGTITKILTKYRETDDVRNQWKGSRPSLLNAEEQKSIVKEVKKNRLLTGVALTRNKKLNIHKASVRTMQRVLRKQGLLPSTNVVQRISAKNEVKRVNFAEIYVGKSYEFFEKIIFSDESDLFPKKCGRLYVRKFKGEAITLDYGPIPRHDPRTIKVWGVISFAGVGPLVLYDGTIDGERYLELLKTHLLAAFPRLRGTKTRKGHFIWQQDNAPGHKSLIVKNWLKENGIEMLDWPAQSPDLNIIENVWAFIQEELWKINYKLENKDDVWRETKKIWYEKVGKIIPKLYTSFPKRLQKVIDNQGKRIDA